MNNKEELKPPYADKGKLIKVINEMADDLKNRSQYLADDYGKGLRAVHFKLDIVSGEIPQWTVSKEYINQTEINVPNWQAIE